MNERPIYTVQATHSGRWWAITAPDLAGVHSQARSIDEIEPMVREAIALWLSATTGVEVAEDDFDVTVDLQLPVSAGRAVAAWRKSADKADRAKAEAAERQVTAAQALVGRAGLTLKDAGQVLGGMSLQRVGQLVGVRRKSA
jgi:predicted RNase H-like HicB family nuclease